jgi:hypothetical protein
MSIAVGVALGFAIVRGIQLAGLTVPWLLHKVRRSETTETERSLVLMIGSRSILLGLAIIVLAVTSSLAALGWVLVGDALLQLFDAIQALSLRKRKLAILPAILCVLDALAGITLLG